MTSSVTLDRHGQGALSSSDDDSNGKAKKGMTDLNQSQLKALVRGGAQVLTQPAIDVRTLLSWDLETTIKHCQSQVVECSSNGQDITEAEEEEWLSKMERIQCAVFEGRRHYRVNQKLDTPVSDQVIDGPRRRRKFIANRNDFPELRGELNEDNEKAMAKEARSQSYEHQKV